MGWSITTYKEWLYIYLNIGTRNALCDHPVLPISTFCVFSLCAPVPAGKFSIRMYNKKPVLLNLFGFDIFK